MNLAFDALGRTLRPRSIRRTRLFERLLGLRLFGSRRLSFDRSSSGRRGSFFISLLFRSLLLGLFLRAQLSVGLTSQLLVPLRFPRSKDLARTRRLDILLLEVP